MTLSVSASTFSGDTAVANGGAVDIYAGSVVVSASTFSANRALARTPPVSTYNPPASAALSPTPTLASALLPCGLPRSRPTPPRLVAPSTTGTWALRVPWRPG